MFIIVAVGCVLVQVFLFKNFKYLWFVQESHSKNPKLNQEIDFFVFTYLI